MQAKDLYLYIIDFEVNQVVRRVDGGRTSTLMKSLLYDQENREHNLQYFEKFRQFVGNQEREGRVLRLPKINEDIAVLKEKGSCLISLYHLKRDEVVRKFLLAVNEPSASESTFRPRKQARKSLERMVQAQHYGGFNCESSDSGNELMEEGPGEVDLEAYPNFHVFEVSP